MLDWFVIEFPDPCILWPPVQFHPGFSVLSWSWLLATLVICSTSSHHLCLALMTRHKTFTPLVPLPAGLCCSASRILLQKSSYLQFELYYCISALLEYMAMELRIMELAGMTILKMQPSIEPSSRCYRDDSLCYARIQFNTREGINSSTQMFSTRLHMK